MSEGPLRILLVEDEPAHAELARRAFESWPGKFLITVEDTLGAARRTLTRGPSPDLVIADWHLPDGDGVELLRATEAADLPPVVIMTSHGSERMAVEVMRAGAVDYVVKSDVGLADLPHVAERALRQRRVEETLADIAGAPGAGQVTFESIVLRLARALRVRYASVVERVSEGRVRTLARCRDGALLENVEYALAGTPCADVVEGTACYVRQGVCQQFPGDPVLRELEAHSYVGLPLVGADGSVRGLVNAVHDRPLQEVVQPEAVLRVFAGRAAAELDRLDAQRALERQRQFAESLLDMVASLVIVVDPEGRIVRFNRACEATSGWTEEEMRGRPFWEVLRPPEGRDEVASAFEGGLVKDRLPPAYESTWLTKAGDRRLLSWVNRPILDEAGRFSLLIGTGVDITESRRTEEALRASEERYRTLMRHAPEAILVTNVDKESVVDANDNAEALFGIDRAKLGEVGPDVLLPKTQPDGTASTDLVRRLAEEALGGAAPVAEVVLRVAGGEERPCEVRVVRLPGSGRLLRLSIIDISERKRLEADLRRAAVEWRQTFDGLPLGVVVVDGGGRVVRANRTAVACSGRSSWSELIDRPLGDVGPGEPWGALAELVPDSTVGGVADPREVTDSSTRRTWVVSASRLPTDGQGPGRIILNFQDVTATAQLKEQLRQTETMAAIGSIVAGVAHEVRNPLFSISATLDAFDARFGKTDGYERYLGVLRGEINRLTILMRDLLEFGRPSRPDLGACRIGDAIRAAILSCEPLARQRHVAVECTSDGSGAPMVLADHGRLVQVLQNLIENAVHFSPAGGRVWLGVEQRGPSEEEWVEISVRDSGQGFPVADLPRLFEPFFTRRRGGTGLGLSIVRRIVYDHGGEVFAWNHPEGGAVVAVRLRRARR